MQRKLSPNQKNILSRKGIVSCNNSLLFIYSDGRAVAGTHEKNTTEQKNNLFPENKKICYVSESKNFISAVDMDGNAYIFNNNIAYPFDNDMSSPATAIECGLNHVAILKDDGHVICIGDTDGGKCNTHVWENIVDICCGKNFTAGLNENGSIFCAGKISKKILKKFGKYELAAVFANPEKNNLYAIDIDGQVILPSGKPITGISNAVFISPLSSPIIVLEDGKVIQNRKDISPADNLTKGKIRKPILCVGNEKHLYYLTSDGILKSNIKNHTRGNVRLFNSFESLEQERKEKKDQSDRLLKEIEKCAANAQKFKNVVHCSSGITVAINSSEHAYSTMYTKNVEKLSGATEIDCSNGHIAVLLANGRVQSFGNNQNGCCNTDSWHGIVSVCTGSDITLGIKSDGGVNIAGKAASINTTPISKWKNIKKIKCESEYIAALDQYGKIQICGNAPFDTESIQNIDSIDDFCISPSHIVLVLKNKSVISFGSDRYGECNTNSWKNIRMAICSENYTAALDYNGKVYATGINSFGQCDTASFSNSVFIACGKNHIASLDIDGKVSCAGAAGYGQCKVNEWKNIVSVYCGDEHTVAVASNGILYACGKNTNNQCMVSQFRIFNSTDTYDIEKNESAGRRLALNNITDSGEILTSKTQPTIVDSHAEISFCPIRTKKFRTNFFEFNNKLAIDKNGSCAVCTEDGAAVFGKTNSFDSKKLSSVYSGGEYFGYIDNNGQVGFIGHIFNITENISDLKATNMYCTDCFCAVVFDDGSVRIFYDNEDNKNIVDVPDFHDIVKIACTNQYILGLTSSGFVKLKSYSAQQNDNETLTDKPLTVSPAICEITNYSGISNIFTHNETVVALLSDGRVMIFEDKYKCAESIKELSSISYVSMSDNCIALLDCDGHIHTFGTDEHGEHDAGQLENIISVSCIRNNIFALDSDGHVYCSGSATKKFPDISNAIAIYGCNDTFCYVDYSGKVFKITDGNLKDTGYNLFTPNKEKNRITMTFQNRTNVDIYSSIGISNTEILLIDDDKKMSIYKNSGLLPFIMSKDSVSCADCGSLHVSYIQNGKLRCIGENSFGQCDLDKSEGAKYVCCNSLSSVLICDDGTVRACGAICKVQGIDKLRDIKNAVMSACGNRHVAILSEDGRVKCVGDNTPGACQTQEWENITMISCGDRHTVGLSSDGHVYSTGDNSCMQLPEKNLSGVMSVACGPYATLCIMYDGTLRSYGFPPNTSKKLLNIFDCVAAKVRENKIFILHSSGRTEII